MIVDHVTHAWDQLYHCNIFLCSGGSTVLLYNNIYSTNNYTREIWGLEDNIATCTVWKHQGNYLGLFMQLFNVAHLISQCHDTGCYDLLRWEVTSGHEGFGDHGEALKFNCYIILISQWYRLELYKKDLSQDLVIWWSFENLIACVPQGHSITTIAIDLRLTHKWAN